MTTRVVVLLSGSGTLCQALLDAIDAGGVDAEVVAVVSDQVHAHGLERARRRGIPAVAHPLAKGADRAAWDAQLRDIVESHHPDLVASAGFMKLLGPAFLERFGGRTINTHPALLPSFPGIHGPRDALRAGVKISGATVFLVDAGVDTGKILLQGAVDVLPGDDVESLHERIKVVERRLLVEAVAAWTKENPWPIRFRCAERWYPSTTRLDWWTSGVTWRPPESRSSPRARRPGRWPTRASR